MARKKAVPTEDIPAVTQLFTPHWIVRYLVENSLGRLWLLNRPSSGLKAHMPYYIEGDAETDFLVINKPEEIKLLDPACGSGHMLTYAFDLLVLIYEEEGYSPNEIPGLILKHNLHGLEICPRAAQLAELALVFKAREQSRRFFQPEQLVRPQIIELQDVQFEDGELNDYIEALDLGELFDPNLFKLLHQFEEAKTFGSLIQPCLDERAIANVRRTIEAKDLGGQFFLRETHLKVLSVLEQAEALTQRYHVVVANPPYMGSKGMNGRIRQFLQDSFEDYKSDLFAAFIVRSKKLAIDCGYLGFMSPFVWMFISSYEKLRLNLINQSTITSLIHLEYSGFEGATVPICTFTLKNHPEPNLKGSYIRLCDFRGPKLQDPKALEAIANPSCGWLYNASSSLFRKIPGQPLAYWISEPIAQTFECSPPISSVSKTRRGLQTGEGPRFVREWFECALGNTALGPQTRTQALASKCTWFPFNSGGYYRRWFGNIENVVNWKDNGAAIKATGKAIIPSESLYFLEAITWSKVSSGAISFRYQPDGVIPGDAGPCLYSERGYDYLLGFLNSNLITLFLQVLSPTLNFEVGTLANIPIKQDISRENEETISSIASEAVGFARADWDNFETSWDFGDQPLLRPVLKGATLEASWQNWEAQSTAAIRRMQELETKNNRLFITAYGLEG